MTAGIKRVTVTGASGYVGTQLIRLLETLDDVDHILATDIRPPKKQFSGKVDFVHHDMTEPMDDLLLEHDIEAVAHLAFILKPSRDHWRTRNINAGGAASVLQSCLNAGVRHMVCFSSTTVYGAHPDNPPLLTEESPIRPVNGFRYGESKAAIEEFLQGFMTPDSGMTMSVLRSCPVIGPNADNFVAKSLSGRVLVAVGGYNPPMQFLHEDDMTAALAYCLLNRVDGVYNVGGSGSITWEEMATIRGRRLLRMPAAILYGLTRLTWALRLQNSSPACGLDFIRYPFVASTEKLEREHGLKAKKTSREAWQDFVDGRKAK